MRRILITGGAGFIGSHVTRLFVNKYPEDHIFNLDKLTYAGNLANLEDVQKKPNYTFIKGDITQADEVEFFFEKEQITHVIHLAAESHVDRSITGPLDFVQTNVLGTVHLMNAAKRFWAKKEDHRFLHVSTDEVYGSLGNEGSFTEETPYSPKSPYSASKASSDLFVKAYFHTYRLPVLISNCSNNYGPYQFPEKLIPLAIRHMVEGKNVPVYGRGENIRDWLYVEDYAEALDLILSQGRLGQTYNVGGDSEWTTLNLLSLMGHFIDMKLHQPEGTSKRLITFVKDRLGHDARYAMNFSKMKKEFNWTPKTPIRLGIERTVDWYLSNNRWVESISSGIYQHYYETQYVR